MTFQYPQVKVYGPRSSRTPSIPFPRTTSPLGNPTYLISQTVGGWTKERDCSRHVRGHRSLVMVTARSKVLRPPHGCLKAQTIRDARLSQSGAGPSVITLNISTSPKDLHWQIPETTISSSRSITGSTYYGPRTGTLKLCCTFAAAQGLRDLLCVPTPSILMSSYRNKQYGAAAPASIKGLRNLDDRSQSILMTHTTIRVPGEGVVGITL
ncbi:hypothetical protein BC827DRAFT_1157103 [Russula dissimulans]|nr:hypothetical protein BC827DRAFT_1157103 [Russula dissimulans]